MICCCDQPYTAPQTPAQRRENQYKNHLNSAVCALFFSFLFAIELFVTTDIISSMAIFFPLSMACLLKAILEAKLAHDLYNEGNSQG